MATYYDTKSLVSGRAPEFDVNALLRSSQAIQQAFSSPYERELAEKKLADADAEKQYQRAREVAGDKRIEDSLQKEKDTQQAMLDYNNAISRSSTSGTMTDVQNQALGNEYERLSSQFGSDKAAQIVSDKASSLGSADASKLKSSPQLAYERVSQLELPTGNIDPLKLIEMKEQKLSTLEDRQKAIDDKLWDEKKFNADQDYKNKSLSLQQSEANARIARENKEDREKDNLKKMETAILTGSIGGEIASGVGQKIVGKGYSDADNAKIAQNAALISENDKTLKQLGDNVAFADKFRNQSTTQTGIEDLYKNRLNQTKTVVSPDGKQTEVPLTRADVQLEIDKLKQEENTIDRTSGYSDKLKERNQQTKAEIDLSRKINLLEMEKQKLDPNISQSKFKNLVENQGKISGSMIDDNVTKANARVESYVSDAGKGFEKNVDISRTYQVPLDDSSVQKQSADRIRNQLKGSGLSSTDIEYAAAKGSAEDVKKNKENRKLFDEKLSKNTKTALENANENEKELVNNAKDKLESYKDIFNSLTKKEVDADEDEIEKAKFEYGKAQEEYRNLLDSINSKRAGKI